MSERILDVERALDLEPLLARGRQVATGIGPDRSLYLLTAREPLEDRIVQEGWASFPKTVLDQPHDYLLSVISEDRVTAQVEIFGERMSLHHVQPLPDDELLLACGRSLFRGPDDVERNGRIYGMDGRFLREILLGDGIEDIQATGAGTIWTSYFDEGIFGNFGWREPLGSSGLVSWDRNGDRLYEFHPSQGLDSISDCYAMNVASDDEVWIYYYTDFPLVRLSRGEITSIWDPPVSGSHAFAVDEGRVLFVGGYSDRSRFHLFEIGSGRDLRPLMSVRLRDENGETIEPNHVVARGDRIWFRSGSGLYRIGPRDFEG